MVHIKTKVYMYFSIRKTYIIISPFKGAFIRFSMYTWVKVKTKGSKILDFNFSAVKIWLDWPHQWQLIESFSKNWDKIFPMNFCKDTKLLTLSWWRPLSCRNQSIDLLCKLMDGFLSDNGLRHERVKKLTLVSRKLFLGSFKCY